MKKMIEINQFSSCGLSQENIDLQEYHVGAKDLATLDLTFSGGGTTDVAHLLANKKYPWEYKKRGGMSDDQIQVDIEKQLDILI